MKMPLPSSRAALAGPRPVHWTCAEFHRFGDLGVFEGRRAMLIDGVILEEGPMNPPHAITLELVEDSLRTAFGTGWRIRSQSPLVLGQDLDPEPDFAVMAGTPRGSSGHPTMADLVVEVAVYRDPRAGDYTTQQALGPADAVSPLAAPATTVQVADLLV
jgi:Uma2 family endonuclease